MNHYLKFITPAVFAFIFSVSSASAVIAADMPHHYKIRLSPEAVGLAGQMGYFRGVATVCRESDGTALNPAFFGPRLAIIPQIQKSLFADAVKEKSQEVAVSMSGPDSALRCDDAIEKITNRYPSVDEAGPAATPLCFDDPVGDYACAGAGEYDPLAGVDAILNGY